MATTRFAHHLLTGDHASRPAAADVPEGTLYSCTDHDLVYQSDTVTWTTWAALGSTVADILDLPTAEMDDTLVLAPDGAGGVEFRAETGGGGGTIAYPSLKSSPTDDFDSALSGWTAVQTGGTFTIAECLAQTLDGSHLFIPYYGNCGFLYIGTTNVDQEWIAGGVMAPTRGGNYFYGIAILDSSNDGVALIFHSSDNTGALISITAGQFDSVQATTTPTAWGTFIGSDTKLWLRLTRTTNTWDAYVSVDGVNWNESTSTINKTITASRCAIGAFLNATAIGALYCDWVKKV